MASPLNPQVVLDQETRAMLTRLSRLKPFALQETMVAAAMPSIPAQIAIERCLAEGRLELRTRIKAFRQWLRGPGRQTPARHLQRRFVFLRLRFNAIVSDFDIFADVLTQRSEHVTGPWLAGLDVAASDALTIEETPIDAPPLLCYLDRGHGAAIRRARTRLPGGGESPVAIVRIPRERMVGAGIASSLVHEVGHQGAAILDLNTSLRAPLLRCARAGADAGAWLLWARWISEITADLWAIARIGVGSTTGLITILSLPRAFIFRLAGDDPHPIPWIRVKLSCAIGHGLYPDPQWGRLADFWESVYPPDEGVSPELRRTLAALERTMPAFVELLLSHRPEALQGRTIRDVLRGGDRTPDALRTRYAQIGHDVRSMRSVKPSLALAMLGQARVDGTVTPEHESRLLSDLLTYWALRQALQTTEFAATQTSTEPPVAAMA